MDLSWAAHWCCCLSSANGRPSSSSVHDTSAQSPLNPYQVEYTIYIDEVEKSTVVQSNSVYMIYQPNPLWIPMKCNTLAPGEKYSGTVWVRTLEKSPTVHTSVYTWYISSPITCEIWIWFEWMKQMMMRWIYHLYSSLSSHSSVYNVHYGVPEKNK